MKEEFICTACQDTHAVWNQDRERTEMCLHCPVPCQGCRADGIGAYCQSVPCKDLYIELW